MDPWRGRRHSHHTTWASDHNPTGPRYASDRESTRSIAREGSRASKSRCEIAQGSYYPLSMGPRELALPYDRNAAARAVHALIHKDSESERTRNPRRRSRAVVSIVVLRLGWDNDLRRHCCNSIFDVHANVSIGDLLLDWQELTTVKHIERYSLRYAEIPLAPTDDVKTLHRMKREIFGDGPESSDGLFVLHVANRRMEFSHIEANRCICKKSGRS